MARTLKRSRPQADRKSQGDQLYAMLLWLQSKSSGQRVPFRHLHYRVLQAGARRLGLKPPARFTPSSQDSPFV